MTKDTEILVQKTLKRIARNTYYDKNGTPRTKGFSFSNLMHDYKLGNDNSILAHYVATQLEPIELLCLDLYLAFGDNKPKDFKLGARERFAYGMWLGQQNKA